MTAMVERGGVDQADLLQADILGDMRPIGAILLGKGLVSQKDVDDALAYQREVGGLIGEAFLRLGAVSEDALYETLSAQLAMPELGADERPAAAAVLEALERLGLSPPWALANEAAPWLVSETVLVIAARDPLSPSLRDVIDRAAARSGGLAVSYRLARIQRLEGLLGDLKRHVEGEREDDEDRADAAKLREMAEEAPVIDFVNRVLVQAVEARASDIHLEPSEDVFTVRLRIDGVLHDRLVQPKSRFDAVVSRVKLMSGMDIAERRLPQDGRQTIRVAGRDYDLRVSSLPGVWGESVVLRLLPKDQELPELDGLGLVGPARARLDRILSETNGVFLITGPTGSGKSTTLYRVLDLLNDGERKILTIEDPVEYELKGVTQVQVRAEIGYTFAHGLRAFLRQDPDVIMVGEIRDGETAAIAAQAALTGHLVFSTLHTNSALAAVMRLHDLGLERFLIASAVRGLAAQRLARRLCNVCARPSSPEEAAAHERVAAEILGAGAALPSEEAAWREPVGCDHCQGAGYRGRVALYELAVIDEALRDAILAGAPEKEMLARARAQGFTTLVEDGAQKARTGLTTLDEVLRVCGGRSGSA